MVERGNKRREEGDGGERKREMEGERKRGKEGEGGERAMVELLITGWYQQYAISQKIVVRCNHILPYLLVTSLGCLLDLSFLGRIRDSTHSKPS